MGRAERFHPLLHPLHPRHERRQLLAQVLGGRLGGELVVGPEFGPGIADEDLRTDITTTRFVRFAAASAAGGGRLIHNLVAASRRPVATKCFSNNNSEEQPMQRRQFLLGTVACAATATSSLTGCGGGMVTGEDYTLIAARTDDLRITLDTPALDDLGRVAFITRTSAVIGDGISPLLEFRAPRAGEDGVAVFGVQVCEAGDIAYAVYHSEKDGPRLTVYHSRGGAPTAVFEGRPMASPHVLRMSDNGRLAIAARQGPSPEGTLAFYCGPAAGPFTLIVERDEFFYHSPRMQFDVDNTGRVAIAMTYLDNGVRRDGIVVFRGPDQPVETLRAAAQRMTEVPFVATNNFGQVAFAIREPATIEFFDPRFPTPVSGGTPIRTLTLEAGVYVTTPMPLGLPIRVRQVASRSVGGYRNFFTVDINDLGTVVFEATLDRVGNPYGIFQGPDPAMDVVAITGHDLVIDKQTHRFSAMALGQVNNRAQVSIVTRDELDLMERVWRVDIAPTSGEA